MTKSIYNKQTNSITELPGMKKPDGANFYNGKELRGTWNHKKYLMAVEEYEKQKNSCRTILCAPNNWSDKQELEEGKDYRVEIKKHDPVECGCEKDLQWCPFNPTATEVPENEKVNLLTAIPIRKEEDDQDELWQELEEILNDQFSLHENLMSAKKMFTIKKKVK